MHVMILAAGRGERMRPLTDSVPKPLLPVAGKPLVAWHLERLAAAGLRDVVINHAWMGERIEAALGDGSRYGVRIRYSREGTALETAGGIARALPLLGGGTFMVINGDVYTDIDFGALAARATGIGVDAALAHLVLVSNPEHHPDGDFALEQGGVRGDGARRLTFSGVGLYAPQLFAAIAPGTRAQLAPLLRAAMAQGRVTGEHFTGRWVDIGTPERLARLDQQLREEAKGVTEKRDRRA